MNWITDLDGAFNRCGDLPSVNSLPHYSPRVAELQSAVSGQGIVARIEPIARRILAVFKRDNASEVERLRKMIEEVANE